jgi:hypothetical protein
MSSPPDNYAFEGPIQEIPEGERPERVAAVYTDHYGKELKHNDHVYVEMVVAPEEDRSGRLVQVRIGCGQFGSDMYFLRLRDGRLHTYENARIRHVDDPDFEEAFYRSNGCTPPVIPEQPLDGCDADPTEPYTIRGDYPEVGFIVHKPSQPQTPGSFGMTIITGGPPDDGGAN